MASQEVVAPLWSLPDRATIHPVAVVVERHRAPLRPRIASFPSGLWGSNPVSKYSALRRQLAAASGGSVEMTFDEVDAIVGGLPASARRHSAWWSNELEGRHVQAHAWMDAGWRVAEVNLTAERVRFAKR